MVQRSRRSGAPAAAPASRPAIATKRFFARKRVMIPVVILGVLVLAGVLYYHPMRILYREARQERVLRAELIAVRSYNADLRKRVASLETTEGVQAYAQSELGLVTKGDHEIVVLQGGKPLKAAQDTREAEIQKFQSTAKPFGVWTDFLDALFRIR